MTVIADAKAVHGIGGIMGGEDTGVQRDTTEVFLEVAYFDPIRIAASGRKLGILSDARYRFERGIDPESVRWGAEVATRLILELCGGEASEIVSSGVMPTWQRSFDAARRSREDADRHRRAGAPRPPSSCGKLGFTVERQRPVDGRRAVLAPRHRGRGRPRGGSDARLRLRQDPDDLAAAAVGDLAGRCAMPMQRRVPQARRALAARGLNEAVTWSFLPFKQAERFGGGQRRPAPAELDRRRRSTRCGPRSCPT